MVTFVRLTWQIFMIFTNAKPVLQQRSRWFEGSMPVLKTNVNFQFNMSLNLYVTERHCSRLIENSHKSFSREIPIARLLVEISEAQNTG